MSMEQALIVGINTMSSMQKMAKLIKFAETKEDIMYILERMNTELEERVAQINEISLKNSM